MHCMQCGGDVPPSATLCADCATSGKVETPGLPPIYTPRRRHTAPASTDMGDVACLAWCILFLVLGATGYGITHPAASAPETIGGGMAGGLLGAIFAGIGRLLGNRRPRKVAVVSWAIVLALSGIGQFSELANHARGRQAREQALTHLAQATQAFNANQPIPAAPAPADPGAFAVDPQANMLHQVDDLATGYIRQVSELRRQIEALHLEDVGKPRHMVSVADIEAGDRALDRYAALLERQNTLSRGYLSDLRHAFEQLPEPTRSSALKGFDRSAAKSLPIMERKISIERDSVATLRSMLAIARANLGQTRAEDGVLYLPQGALAKYQAALGHLQELVDQEQAVDAQLAAQKADFASTMARLRQVAAGP